MLSYAITQTLTPIKFIYSICQETKQNLTQRGEGGLAKEGKKGSKEESSELGSNTRSLGGVKGCRIPPQGCAQQRMEGNCRGRQPPKAMSVGVIIVMAG